MEGDRPGPACLFLVSYTDNRVSRWDNRQLSVRDFRPVQHGEESHHNGMGGCVSEALCKIGSSRGRRARDVTIPTSWVLRGFSGPRRDKTTLLLARLPINFKRQEIGNKDKPLARQSVARFQTPRVIVDRPVHTSGE
ncbi:hypothetical protein RRG08_031053 [Elysia crispata]|uniref:Uncharacterized protein n=1 Tax=Elysia crispata TaxID=231223 RepID=A0AAE0ZF55_9GAST|nr:hypothetical protein RRG08_031053 [Elysia crispata]